jgi:hypothetical protein
VTARFLVGDVFDRVRCIPDGSVDLVVTSPPFLRLRSYLPDDHPDKPLEIGSEETPAAYLDMMLRLTAEWARVLAPHGSICIELGDTFAGSGGAGGDYRPGGSRGGQLGFRGSDSKYRRRPDPASGGRHPLPDRFRQGGPGGDGWPLPKSLCGIPTLYAWSLAYGTNLLSHEPSPAGRWRVRSLKPWIRTNPPVGSLGDKERPATTFITVATRASRRYFDLDAARTGTEHPGEAADGEPGVGGSPPRDWWHHVDAVLDAALAEFAGGTTHSRGPRGARRTTTGKAGSPGRGGNWMTLDTIADGVGESRRVRGWHLRRALEGAGILRTLEALDVNPRGYGGAHYAVWPEQLVLLLLEEMCPRRVCTTCGEPARRVTDAHQQGTGRTATGPKNVGRRNESATYQRRTEAATVTTGWSDCGHDSWRPGLVLDPFVGSGTTLAVAAGTGRDAVGIDINPANADLARERVGMFLEVDSGSSAPDHAVEREGA